MRSLLALSIVALIACGGDDGEGGGGKNNDGPTPTVGVECDYTGVVEGCLAIDSIDCTDNASMDGVSGGWFNDEGDSVTIGFDVNPDGYQFTFTILNGGSVATGSEHQVPTEVLAEIVDLSDPDAPQTLFPCPGTLRVSQYQPGTELWGVAQMQAHNIYGICNDIGFVSLNMEFIKLEYCAL